MTKKLVDMDIEKEIQKITLDIQNGKEDFVSGTKRILCLLYVINDTKQMSSLLHNSKFKYYEQIKI